MREWSQDFIDYWVEARKSCESSLTQLRAAGDTGRIRQTELAIVGTQLLLGERVALPEYIMRDLRRRDGMNKINEEDRKGVPIITNYRPSDSF